MLNDKIQLQMFQAACVFIMITLIYAFICIFVKPVVDLTTPIFGMGMLLLGYYWGPSKSSKDKDGKRIT